MMHSGSLTVTGELQAPTKRLPSCATILPMPPLRAVPASADVGGISFRTLKAREGGDPRRLLSWRRPDNQCSATTGNGKRRGIFWVAWKQVTQFQDAGDWLFPSPVKLGRLPCSYTGYWRALQTETGRAGLGRMGTHTFRHSYRSWLDSVGTAITVQQKLMRHSDIQTTLNIYGDVVTDEMERAGSKVAALALNPDSKLIPAAVSH
jgi:integrase